MKSAAAAFGALHVPGRPLILYNVWDAGSARAVAEAGAQAIATGSWGVACAHGYKDGETLPLDEVLGFVDQLLAVLEVAHDQGIVHRDTKPSNLFLVDSADGTSTLINMVYDAPIRIDGVLNSIKGKCFIPIIMTLG